MIQTRSKFYFVESVSSNNYFLNFDEGGGELTAVVDVGNYTPTELAQAIENALNDAGTNTYTADFDRVTRKITITGSGAFDLLVATGTNVGTDVFSLIGFTGSDRTGGSTYTGNADACTEYLPQFLLQDWIDQEDLQKAISPSIVKSASGIVEVVKFGTEKFFEFNIRFITDVDQGNQGWVETNLTGVDDARTFMRFLTSKRNVEFMPDRDTPSTFYTVMLESTPEERDGTGYRLKELYDKDLPDYFETGKLTFRLVE